MNRKTSQCSGKTKNSSIASYMSMQSLFSKNSSPNLHSVSSYNLTTNDQTIQDLKKELSDKEKTINLLESRIEELINSDKSKNPSNPEYLHKLIKKGDQKLENLKSIIENITKENEALMTKQRELLSLISKYKKENSELKQCVTKSSDFSQLESRIKEIESMHSELICENSELKNEINRLNSKSEEIDNLKVSVLCSEIIQAKNDISLILKVLRTMKTGKELNINLLLNHQPTEENFFRGSYRQCSSVILQMRKEIEEIKAVIVDFKAEFSGSQCTTQ